MTVPGGTNCQCAVPTVMMTGVPKDVIVMIVTAVCGMFPKTTKEKEKADLTRYDKIDWLVTVVNMDKGKLESLTDEEIDSVFCESVYHKSVYGDKSDDPVNHPKHYTNTSIECIDAMVETQGKEAVIQFCICNAFKYLWRHNSKNGDEDIKKAAWYLNKAVELGNG